MKYIIGEPREKFANRARHQVHKVGCQDIAKLGQWSEVEAENPKRAIVIDANYEEKENDYKDYKIMDCLK